MTFKMGNVKLKGTRGPRFSRNLSSIKRPNFCRIYFLNRFLKHLAEEKKRQNVASFRRCPIGCRIERVADHQVKLKSRQLPNVVGEIRRAVMRHDWDYVAALTLILCQRGVKCYITLIFKVCIILLTNHPKSNFSLMQNFIRHVTGYILDEDVNKFIKILFIMRTISFRPLGRGKYKRWTGDYKVTRDPEFENL